MSLEVLLLVGVVVVGAALVFLWRRSRARLHADELAASAKLGNAELDTVSAWPPEATRLLTGGERAAHEILVKAVPECMVFAQVPLARFLKVPRRHSYTEWLTRVGHLAADLVLTDRATQVIGVVLLEAARESERGERRRSRMTRVLKAAGVKVFIWREVALPTAALARDQLIQRLGEVSTATPEPDATSPHPLRPATMGHGKLPVPEVVAEIDDHDGPRREPPPSTWFDDLDSGRVPLDPHRKPPAQ
jgi:hypothetical protein